MVIMNEDMEIELKIGIEIEKTRSTEEKVKNKISQNFNNLCNKKIVKILPDNCGTIFSIEASTCGASF